MKIYYFLFISFLALLLACSGKVTEMQVSEGQPSAAGISFAKDVKPIFAQNCSCHLAEEPPDDLSLASYDNFNKGSEHGPVFIPHNSTDSLIVKKIIPGGGMPPGGQLSQEAIDRVRKWIDEGGKNN